jgi:vancomycin permeability regulator SanA
MRKKRFAFITFVRAAIACLGVLLLVDGFVLITVINFNVGTLGTIGLGAIFVLWSLSYNKLKRWASGYSKYNWKKWMYGFGLLMIAGFLSCMVFIGMYGLVDTVTYKEKALIVLDAGIHGEAVSMPLKYRLDAAVTYQIKNPEAVIVVSGGQGSGELITEALAMEKYLIKCGVARNKIIKEELSTSTYENFMFSKALLKQHFKQDVPVVFISNDFHLFRAQQISRITGMNATHLGAGLSFYMLPVVYVREVLALVKFLVFRQ